MKILFVTDLFPYPLNTGGRIVSYQQLRTLANKHDIHLLARASEQPTSKELKAITSLGIEITTVMTKKTDVVPIFELMRSFLNLRPLILYHYYEPEFEEKMTALLETKHFDVLHIDHLYMAQFLPKEKKHQWILTEHNIEYRLQLGLLKNFRTSLWKKLRYAYDTLTVKLYERQKLPLFDQVIVLNENDRAQVVELGVAPKKVFIAPPWQEIPLHPMSPKKSKELLFVGSIWWPPNFDAAQWFIQEVFPKLQKKISNISLKIIGSSCQSLEPFTRGNSSIKLLEALEDLTPHLKNARAFVLPFRIGEGTRIKALTAFSWSLPVVSTKKGMQGLEVKARRDYLEAQTADEFVEQIDRLFNDKSIESSLIKNMKNYLEKRHSMKDFQRNFLLTYAAGLKKR